MAKINAQSKVNIDPVFEDQVRNLQQKAAAEAAARLAGGQVPWMTPKLGEGEDDYDGDLFDFEGMAQPFNREGPNQQAVEAMTAENPGVSGDFILASIQVDYLACMERAYRMRHTMRRPRALAHTTARKRGHGHERGPLVQSVLEYARGVEKHAKSATRQTPETDGDG